jgi:hypothetical protein
MQCSSAQMAACLGCPLAGIATVPTAIVISHANFCILDDASASIGLDDVAGLDETHNYGENHREVLLRPEAAVVLGPCSPTSQTCAIRRFVQTDAAEPGLRTQRSAPRHRERNGAHRSPLPDLVPMHGRGRRPP